mgnify:CR=1 FL=1
MTGTERRATLKVERGLSTLHYRGEPSVGDAPPSVEVVSTSPGVSLLAAPGEPFGVLSGPGRALVVVAEAPGSIEIAVAGGRSGSDPRLELTRVGAESEPAAPPELRLRPDLPEGGVEFLLRAHVSLRGDLAAPRGHWICGPDAPGRIEGIEMRGVAADLPLEYQVASAGRDAGWSPWAKAGTYAGTRGKALPIIGLRVRFLPDAAPGLALRADGVFLGASVVTRTGREIELAGPTPLDPLVGVRLDFARAAPMRDAGRPAAPVRQPSRLRIFRRPVPEAQAA